MNSPEGPSDPSSGINHPHHLVWLEMAMESMRRCLFLSVESGFHEAGSLLQALRATRHATLGNFTMLGSAVLVRRPARCTPCVHVHGIAHKVADERPASARCR